MAEEKEVLKYELDVTDVEAKAQRMLQLLEQIKAARGKNEGTDELEAQLNKEMHGLGKLAEAKKGDASATELALRHKEKLAGVVNMLGGGFGELAGRVLGTVEALLSAGKALAIWIGLASAVAGAVTWMRAAREEAEKLAQAQEKANEVALKGQLVKVDEAGKVGLLLESYGARSEENVSAGFRMSQGLRGRFGFTESQSTGGAALAVAGGLTENDAAVLIQLQAQGVDVKSVEEARQKLAIARQVGDYAKLLGKSGELDPAKRPIMTDVDTQSLGGLGAQPVGLVYESLSKRGALPPDMTLEQFRSGVQGLPALRARLERMRASLAYHREHPTEADYGRGGGVRVLNDEIANLQDQIAHFAVFEQMVQRENERAGTEPVGNVAIDSNRYNSKEKTGRAGTLDRLNASPQQTTINNVVNISQQVVTNPLRWENFWFPGYAGDSARGGNR